MNMLEHEFLIIILLQLFNFNLYVQRTVVVPIFHPELICHFCVCAFRSLSLFFVPLLTTHTRVLPIFLISVTQFEY